MQTTKSTQAGARTLFRKSSLQSCKFCGELVNLDDEGVQYRDGSAAHEACDDGEQFNKANAADFRD